MSSSTSENTATLFGNYDRIRPSRSLAGELVERVRADILGGDLPAGSRLPTEQEMIATFGVSRTVVREAVAALRAEGLVATRQGVGAFVARDTDPRPFRIEPDGLGSIEELLALMELRTGVETEAAGLAARRAGKADLKDLENYLARIDAALARGEPAVAEDFEFHRRIAATTQNAYFIQFLEFLGRYIIPRQTVRIRSPDPMQYLRTIQAEHRNILSAIRKRSAEGAQAAMRLHLTKSRERYASLGARGARR